MHRNPSVTLPSRAERPAERDTHRQYRFAVRIGYCTRLHTVRYHTAPYGVQSSRSGSTVSCGVLSCPVYPIVA